MLVRAVIDQPWNVPADVLAIPFLGDLVLDGPLGELDRRSSGELAALSAFGEINSERYSGTLVKAGDNAARRLLAICAGEAADLDRETAVRVGAAAERRLGGRTVRTLAIWLDPLAAVLDGGAEAVAGLVARGVVEGAFDPATIYRDNVTTSPPRLDELILIVGSGDGVALTRAAELR